MLEDLHVGDGVPVCGDFDHDGAVFTVHGDGSGDRTCGGSLTGLCKLESTTDSRLDGVGGDGGASHAVDINGVCLDDAAGHPVDGDRADTLDLAVLTDFHLGNDAVFHNDIDDDGAVFAVHSGLQNGGADGGFLGGGGGFLSRLTEGSVSERLGDGGADGVGGDGRAGYGVDVDAVCRHDRGGDAVNGDGAHALGLVVLQHVDLVDGAAVSQDLHHHVAILADASANGPDGLARLDRGFFNGSLLNGRGFGLAEGRVSEGPGHGGTNGVGSDGRAGDGVHIHGVCRHDRGGDLLHGAGADARGLVLLGDGDGIDGVLVGHDLNGHVADLAEASAVGGDFAVFADNGGGKLSLRGGFLGGSRLGGSRFLNRCGFLGGSAGPDGFQSLGDGGLDGGAGNGGTGDAVDICGVSFHNRAGELFNGYGADARSLVLGENVDRVDLVGVGGDLNDDGAVDAVGLGLGGGGTLGNLGGSFSRRGGLGGSRFRCRGSFARAEVCRIKARGAQGLGDGGLDGGAGHGRT